MTENELPPPGRAGEQLLAGILRTLDDMGLYSSEGRMQVMVRPGTFHADDWKTLVSEGGEMIVRVLCDIGQVAWSDRILRPEIEEERKAFELTAPTEDEIWLNALKSGINLDELDASDGT